MSTTSFVEQQSTVRTYGGWRRTRGLGLGSLDTRSSGAVILLVAVLTAATAVGGVRAGAMLLPVVVPTLAVLLWRYDGVPLLDHLIARDRYRRAAGRGETTYRGSVLLPWPKAGNLPGVLAPTELLDVEIPGRARCGMVWDRRTGLMSVTLLLSSAGTLLSDRDTADGYVSSWGSLLASFADVPAIRWAAVTVETTPDAGNSLRRDMDARIDPDAPEWARAVMADLVEAAPAGAARVSTRLTLTVDPTMCGERIVELSDGVAATLRVLECLNTAGSGVEVLRAAGAADLARMVRAAFDPSSRQVGTEDWERIVDTPLWGLAGPAGAKEEPDRYVHDGAVSVSWAMLEAPRQRVAANVLLRLLAPGRFARRVTLLYRVLDREEAGSLLQKERTAVEARAAYRVRTKRDETARERKDRVMAHGAAEEEAAGAGLVQFSMFVTATVADPEDLPAARAEVEHAAGASRVKLRLCHYGQAAAFAVGLPAGVYPPFAKASKAAR
ncbi:MAG: SCO6880 family protein [Sporichthyaceae bacterium]